MNRKHLLILCLLLGSLGLAAYFIWSKDVFPSASIDLKVSRPDILRMSEDWARKLHYKPDDAIRSTIFAHDDAAKTFLEYELGLAQANSLMKDRIPVWYWSTRMCRPLQLEEMSVALSPSGKLISFDRKLENDRAMPAMDHNAAKQLAIDFAEKEAGVPLAGFKPVEDGSVSQPNRTDHYFTWEDTTTDFKGAHLRVYEYVSGNELTTFNYYLYRPERWMRKFSELRSYNHALEQVASIFYSLFNIATFFVFVWAFTHGLIRWRFAFGLGLLMAGIDFAESVNSMPVSIHGYPTTMSFRGFIVDTYVSAASSAVSQFVQTAMLVGAGEALYRLANPHKIALENFFKTAGLRTQQALQGLIAGHGMAGIHLGWVIFYYLLGRPLGFWSPLEVQNVEDLSTTFPFFSAMNVGATAGLFEELTYRVLGLFLLQRVLPGFWLPNLLQAAMWAFMHSNYPQEPPYARGLELTAVGVFYGFMLKQFGLVSCIVSHFVFDTFLGVTPLLSSSEPTLQTTAVLAVAPFVVALAVAFILQRRYGRKPEEEVENSTVPRSHIAEQIEDIFPHTPYEYRPLSRRLRLGLGAIAAAAVLIQFLMPIPTVGGDAQLRVSREDAIHLARRYLLDNHISTEQWMTSAYLTRGIDSEELQYVFEKSNLKKTAVLADETGFPLVWQVRFFRPMDPQEYTVALDSSGRPLSIAVSMAEDTAGARLSQQQAIEKSDKYLRTEHADLQPYKMEDISKQDRKARTDYNLTYEVPKYRVAEAHFKAFTSVIGDIVCNYDQKWDLPDKWRFERMRQTFKDQAAGYALMALGLILSAAGLWWVVGIARSGAIRWRLPFFLAAITALLAIPQVINDLPELYVGYSTETPLLSYFTAQAVNQVLTVISSLAIIGGLSAFALATMRLLLPRTPVTVILKAGLLPDQADKGRTQWNFWVDAVLVGFAVGIGTKAFVTLMAILHAYFSPVVTMAPLATFCAMTNVSSPALDSIMDGLTRGLQLVLLAAICAGLYAKYFRSFKMYLVIAILVSLIHPSTERYWQDYVVGIVSDLFYLLLGYLFAVKIARFNILAYFLAGASGLLAGNVRVLLNHGVPVYTSDIVFLWLVLFAPVGYLLYLYVRNRRWERLDGTTSVDGTTD